MKEISSKSEISRQNLRVEGRKKGKKERNKERESITSKSKVLHTHTHTETASSITEPRKSPHDKSAHEREIEQDRRRSADDDAVLLLFLNEIEGMI